VAQPAGTADPLRTLSSIDIYLDATALLPVALAFSTHPDNNALTNVSVEVDFSNYETVNGAQVPFHIEKYMNGSLFLDVIIQHVNVNSGLTESVFAFD
jgi:hypothetical protein